MIRVFALLAALLFAAPAFAQDNAPAPTAEQIMAAKAHADAVITRSEAGEFFVNVTDSDIPRVRHTRSGMICVFTTDDARDAISFYPVVANGPARGDDVSCGSWWGTTFVSMFATRYPQAYSADDLIASAAAEIRGNWQNVVPVEGSFPIISLTGQEQPLVAAFTAEREGQRRRTLVVLRNIDGWSFKTRATGQVDDPEVTKMGTLAFAVSIPGGWDIFTARD